MIYMCDVVLMKPVIVYADEKTFNLKKGKNRSILMELISIGAPTPFPGQAGIGHHKLACCTGSLLGLSMGLEASMA